MLFIEWYLVGFYPGSGKAGIHVAMFTNWAAVFIVPRIFASKRADPALRSRVKRTIITYSFAAPPLVLVLPIPAGGSVAILMTIYSITLSFMFVPFLTHNKAAARKMKSILWLCVAAAMINILVW